METWLLFLVFLLPAILTGYVIINIFIGKKYFYQRMVISSYSLGFWFLQTLAYFFSIGEGQDILGKNSTNIFSKILISIKYYWTWVYPGWVLIFLIFAFVPALVIYIIGKDLEKID
jgi:hypothetical protein